MKLDSLEQMAIGLVTAGVEAYSPGLEQKAYTVANKGVASLEQHNPGLMPVFHATFDFLESFAAEHGLGVVGSFVAGFLPTLAQMPAGTTVATPAT